jgi:hypothetical protein
MTERSFTVVEREDGFYVEERVDGAVQPHLSGPYLNRAAAQREADTLQTLLGKAIRH